MSAGNNLENKLLDHLLTDPAFTPGATVRIALFTADPTDTESLAAEVAGGAYARVATTAADWGAAAGGSKTNTAVLTFPTASASWGTITHFGIVDSASGAVAWMLSGTVTPNVAVGNGQTASFAASALVLTCD